ncbi:MAG: helix-turn-helix domain-containing protein [Bacteroidetes bacterium]|nr:helix-turn-helix domain-containing protein [Bacteroidota bacterium]
MKIKKLKILENRSGCPVSTSLDVLGDKWSLIIIRDIFVGRTSFTDFLNSPEKISTNILKSRLNKLEYYEIIYHKVSKIDRKVKNYFLTEKGMDLYPLVYELSMWSLKHLDFEHHPISVEWIKAIKGKSSSQVIEETVTGYKDSIKDILSS